MYRSSGRDDESISSTQSDFSDVFSPSRRVNGLDDNKQQIVIESLLSTAGNLRYKTFLKQLRADKEGDKNTELLLNKVYQNRFWLQKQQSNNHKAFRTLCLKYGFIIKEDMSSEEDGDFSDLESFKALNQSSSKKSKERKKKPSRMSSGLRRAAACLEESIGKSLIIDTEI
jgi:hypothetical protein